MEPNQMMEAFLRRVLPPRTDKEGTSDEVVDPAQMSVRQLRDAIKGAGLEEEAKGMFEKSELVDLLLNHYSTQDKK